MICLLPLKDYNTSDNFVNTCKILNSKTRCVSQSSRTEKFIHAIGVQRGAKNAVFIHIISLWSPVIQSIIIFFTNKIF